MHFDSHLPCAIFGCQLQRIRVHQSTESQAKAGGSMIRPLLTTLVCLSIAACASSGPETPERVTSKVAPEEPAAAVGATQIAGDNEATEGELEVIDVPEVPKTAKVAAPVVAHSDQLVCKRIRTTGSHRVTRVCRTRAEIEAARAEAQNMMRGLNNKAQGSPSQRDRSITRSAIPGGRPDFR